MDDTLYDHEIDALPPPLNPAAASAPLPPEPKGKKPIKGERPPPPAAGAFARWIAGLSLPDVIGVGLMLGVVASAVPMLAMEPTAAGIGGFFGLILSAPVLWWLRRRTRWVPIVAGIAAVGKRIAAWAETPATTEKHRRTTEKHRRWIRFALVTAAWAFPVGGVAWFFVVLDADTSRGNLVRDQTVRLERRSKAFRYFRRTAREYAESEKIALAEVARCEWAVAELKEDLARRERAVAELKGPEPNRESGTDWERLSALRAAEKELDDTRRALRAAKEARDTAALSSSARGKSKAKYEAAASAVFTTEH